MDEIAIHVVVITHNRDFGRAGSRQAPRNISGVAGR